MNINFTLIAQAITFAIFVWFTVKFVWPPLLNAIEKRQKEIADGLAAAQEGKLSFEAAAKKNAESLSEVKQKGAEIDREHQENASSSAVPSEENSALQTLIKYLESELLKKEEMIQNLRNEFDKKK